MRNGFPTTVVHLLTVMFVASLVATLGWFAYFASDVALLGRPDALGGLWLTAALSGSVSLNSGLLAFHYEHSDDYTSGEDVLYRLCAIVFTGILLCSGAWAALISLL